MQRARAYAAIWGATQQLAAEWGLVALEDLPTPESPTTPPGLDVICAAVAEVLDVEVEALRSESRRAALRPARALVTIVARGLGYRLADVAVALGRHRAAATRWAQRGADPAEVAAVSQLLVEMTLP